MQKGYLARVMGGFRNAGILDLRELGFRTVDPLRTGHPAYHPAMLLKLYIYGYLNRIAASRLGFP